MMPFCTSSARPVPGDGGAEDHGLGEDAGDQELAVELGVAAGDRPAEHVREEQHEHDRRQRGEHQQVRNPLDLDEVAFGDDQSVGQWRRARSRRAPPRLRWWRDRSGSGRRRPGWAGGARRPRWRCGSGRAAAAPRSAPERRRSPGRSAPGGRGRAPADRWRDRPSTVAAASSWAGSATVISSRSPPTCAFSSSAVPCAMTRPWSITTIVSASRSASSRYWVVSSSVVPPATSCEITSHMSSRPFGSRPGGGLVQEQDLRVGHQRAGQVEPPAHAARVGLGRPVAGLARARTAPAARGPGPGSGVRPRW